MTTDPSSGSSPAAIPSSSACSCGPVVIARPSLPLNLVLWFIVGAMYSSLYTSSHISLHAAWVGPGLPTDKFLAVAGSTMVLFTGLRYVLVRYVPNRGLWTQMALALFAGVLIVLWDGPKSLFMVPVVIAVFIVGAFFDSNFLIVPLQREESSPKHVILSD